MTIEELDQRYYPKGVTYDRDEIAQLVSATASGNRGPALITTNPGAHQSGRFFTFTSPGTYTSFLDSTGAAIVIPAPAAGKAISEGKLYDTGAYFIADYTLVNIPTVDISGLATKASVDGIANAVAAITKYAMTAPLPFRRYSGPGVYDTTATAVVQSDAGDTMNLARNAEIDQQPVFYRTGHTMTESVGTIKVLAAPVSIITTAGFGFGCIRADGTAFGYVYRGSDGVFFKQEGYSTVTPILGTELTFTVGDTIEFDLILGTPHKLALYKNGTLVNTYTLPEKITGELCWLQRGAFAANVSKPLLSISKVAAAADVTALQGAVNANYPFLKTATFLAGLAADVKVDVSWMKNFVVSAQFTGFDPSDKLSIYLANRAFSISGVPTWTLDVYKDTGDGSGASKIKVLGYTTTVNPEGTTGYQKISVTSGSLAMNLWIYWPAMATGTQRASMTYNGCGLDKGVLVNFNSAVTTVAPVSGISRVQWQYNNINYPTLEIGKFTVVADRNPDNGQISGCTGMGYNPYTKQFVIAQYNYTYTSKIYIYDRKSLTPYAATPPAVLTIAKVIDLSAYMEHIEGIDYDPDLRAYWAIGCVKGSNQSRNILVAVKENGDIIDSLIMDSFAIFQPGMVAVYGDSLYIKPNDKNYILEINKRTKEVIRQVTTFTINEGLAINRFNGNIWLGDDSGLIREYTNAIGLIGSFSSTTFGNGVEGMLSDVDDTVWIAADTFLHGGNTNGNALWHYDPLHTFDKFFRFPDMAGYEQGVIGTGLRVEKGVLIGAGTWESPIMDFGTYTDFLTNLPIITQTGKTVVVTVRGSTTAPTTTVKTEMTIPYYQAWGTTVPDSYTSSPVNKRYQQVKLTIS